MQRDVPTQLVVHICANKEVMGSNPVEALKLFLGLSCTCSNYNYHMTVMVMSTVRFFSCRVLAIFSPVPLNEEPVHRVPILGGVALFLGAFLQKQC